MPRSRCRRAYERGSTANIFTPPRAASASISHHLMASHMRAREREGWRRSRIRRRQCPGALILMSGARAALSSRRACTRSVSRPFSLSRSLRSDMSGRTAARSSWRVTTTKHRPDEWARRLLATVSGRLRSGKYGQGFDVSSVSAPSCSCFYARRLASRRFSMRADMREEHGFGQDFTLFSATCATPLAERHHDKLLPRRRGRAQYCRRFRYACSQLTRRRTGSRRQAWARHVH